MIKNGCEKQMFENGWLNLDNPSPNVIIINKNFKRFWFLDEWVAVTKIWANRAFAGTISTVIYKFKVSDLENTFLEAYFSIRYILI
jgi:hypothetical protein